MPADSTDTSPSLLDRATAQRNVAIYAAILVAVPAAYGFRVAVDAKQAGFLLLLTLAVGVPTSYNTYWPADDGTWRAVGWVIVASVVAAAAFAGLFLAGTGLASLSPFLAGVCAFLVTITGVNAVPMAVFGRAG